MRTSAALLAALAIFAGCSHRVTTPESPKVSIYYSKAGSDSLVRVPFSVDPKLDTHALASYVLSQLIAGPADNRDSLVLFPPGTQAAVTTNAGVATVNLSGSVARSYQGGAGDEAGMFKSLTYTMTGLPGISSVQVLVDGRKQASLPGGHFELDEPLTRETFAQ